MKIIVLSLLALYATQATAAAVSYESAVRFRPYRIAFPTLSNDDEFNNKNANKESFHDALTSVGMVSVTGVYSSLFNENEQPSHGTPNDIRKETLAYLHQCAMVSDATQAHTYSDGTVRYTMATISIPGGVQSIKHGNSTSGGVGSDPCTEFSQASEAFREIVGTVTQVFATRLTSILNIKNDIDGPLLSTEYGYPFPTLADVVENGEHLEHFHSYQKAESKQRNGEETIEWHTDQGLFLVFTPGRKVHCHKRTDESSVTEGFYILQNDGVQALVEFDDEDDLVFMLGDGVNQYVNTRLENENRLRATPHSLSMPDHGEDESRVWYGRMVLPPPEAIHPEHGISFGDLREQMIGHSSSTSSKQVEGESYSLGCSSSMIPRQLEELTCLGDSIYCWHRCMNQSTYNVSESICAEQGLIMNCTNPRGQLYDFTHGDFFPGCVRPDAEMNTPFPTLPEYPRSNTTCTEEGFTEFAKSDGFDHEYEIIGKPAKFMWSVVGNEVHGRLVYNGLFGWIAFGFANPDGGLNGMLGGHIIMALPGSNYSAVVGLDLDAEVSIDEYIIDEEETSFRHWQEPYTATSRSLREQANVVHTSCYTALEFNASSIASQSFNISGVDDIMWAANGVDYFAGYHGQDRSRFIIDWAAGAGKVWIAPTSAPTTSMAPTVAHHNDSDHDHDHDEDSDHDHEEDTVEGSASSSSYWFFQQSNTRMVAMIAVVVGIHHI